MKSISKSGLNGNAPASLMSEATARTAPQHSATNRHREQMARWNAIKDEVIERYTADAVRLATLRAIDPASPEIEEILVENPWIDEDFPPYIFEPEHNELDYDYALSNRLEGAIN